MKTIDNYSWWVGYMNAMVSLNFETIKFTLPKISFSEQEITDFAALNGYLCYFSDASMQVWGKDWHYCLFSKEPTKPIVLTEILTSTGVVPPLIGKSNDNSNQTKQA